MDSLLVLFIVALVAPDVTSSQEICAKVKVDNITDGVLRVTENTLVSLMLHLETENCPQNLTYFLSVFTVRPKVRQEVHMCKIVFVDDFYQVSDNSASHCHPGSSANKIKFIFNVTSLDMRLRFTLASLDMVSIDTYINISEENISARSPVSGISEKFTPVDAAPSILEDNEQLLLTSKPSAPGVGVYGLNVTLEAVLIISSVDLVYTVYAY